MIKPAPLAKQPAARQMPKRSPRKRPLVFLVRGNTKLGPKLIWSFSIPAIETCPGSTEVCRSLCYATQGHYRFDNVQSKYTRNFHASRRDDFVDEIVDEIGRGGVEVLRIHGSGDLYSPAYALKWRDILERCPETTGYLYTRSWVLPHMRPAIESLAELPNVHMWYSLDKETGVPKRRPPGVRFAYMVLSDEEEALIPSAADLVFRVKEGRPAKWMNGVKVCVYEDAVERKQKITCEKCKICFSQARDFVRPATAGVAAVGV
jgi:hypothetical protein